MLVWGDQTFDYGLKPLSFNQRFGHILKPEFNS